jgi:predicted ATPase
LDFHEGFGTAVVNEAEYGGAEAEMRREEQKLDSPEILAIKGLGQFEKFRVVSTFRKMIERWHLSDFHIQAARPSQEDGYAEHLSPAGDNLALVTRFLHDRHPDVFARILDRMARRVPGVSSVEATSTVDGRLVLRFQDGAFKDPFIARYVSDGTIKMFAYLVLLHDPRPHPLLCVEEPENQLYPSLLAELVEEFRDYARRGGQVLASTHSPDLLNAARPEEVFWLTKHQGKTLIRRVTDHPQVLALLSEGDTLGALWKQGLLDGADP